MADAGIEKQCVVCGTDCAGMPRTKDGKGRYFCKPCMDEIAAARREGCAAPELRYDRTTAPQPVDDDPLSLLGGSLEGLEDDLGTEILSEIPVAAPPKPRCPSCRSEVKPGAAVCVRCGTDLRSGQLLETRQLKARAGTRSPVWPYVIGAIGVGFGALGAIGSIQRVVEAFQGGRMASGLVGGVIGFSVSYWHLTGSVATYRRKPEGPAKMRGSAAVWLVLTLIASCALAVAYSAMKEQLTKDVDPEFASVMMGAIVVAVVLGGAWPIFVLGWTSLPFVRRDIESWR